jgi:hypothetical protein
MRFSRSLPFLARATPSGGGGGPALVQRSVLPSGVPSRGVFTDATVTFSSNITAGNTIVIYAASNGVLGTTTTSASDTVVMFDEEVFGGAAYWTQLGYIINAVGGSTTITMTSAGAGVHTIYAEEWSGLTAYNSTAGVGANTGVPPLTVSTPNATDVATAVSFISWSYFGNTLDGSTQAIPSGFTEGARYTTAAGGNAGRAQLIGGYRAETATGIKSATWGTWQSEFIATQIMVIGA